MELSAGARHRHIEQPSLLVDALFRASRHAGGEVPVVQREHVDRLPLQSLGRVDRGEHEVVLVAVRRSCEVSARLRWIEHKLAHEVPQVSAVLTGGGDQLLEIAQSAVLDERDATAGEL
jgi:hypothetical protein